MTQLIHNAALEVADLDFEIEIQGISNIDDEGIFENFQMIECINEDETEQSLGDAWISANFQTAEDELLKDNGEFHDHNWSFCHHEND